MQGEAGRMAQRERTEELTEQVGRTKIPPDFVSFMSRGRERNEAKETAVPFLPKGLLFWNYNHLILLCSSIKMEISPKSPISFGRTNILFGFAYFIKCSFMESTSKSSMLLFVLKPIGSM